ncbi:hypothetical protein DN745_13255 [Bradymonas sediminis]|uniref:Outer membrane protein beta-barrel domain-containing protein n=2 Tax=Bradymonas sediminis TaxID=1548548 RepID=A0A2Z4FMS5_9DELT|nr:hypothetical protein DN745_13255 [Bradymonas sediminis]
MLGATLMSAPASAQEAVSAEPAEATIKMREPTPTLTWSQEDAIIINIRSATYDTPDDSFDAFGSDANYMAGQIEVGYDLGAILLPGLRGYLIYSGGGFEKQSRFNGALDLGWRRDMVMVAADYGPELWGFFRPSLRLGGGYSVQTLDTTIDGIERQDRGHGAAGFGALSLEFFTPKGFLSNVQVGVVVEAGGLLQTNATFDEMEVDGGEDDGWAHEQTSLGTLKASGKFVTAGAEVIVSF